MAPAHILEYYAALWEVYALAARAAIPAAHIAAWYEARFWAVL